MCLSLEKSPSTGDTCGPNPESTHCSSVDAVCSDLACVSATTKDAGIRYKYFFTPISIVFEQDFHRMAVDRHAKKYLNKLRYKSFEGELALSLGEVILYEELWRLLTQILENKRIKLR